jgi:putative phage-type endonuclease
MASYITETIEEYRIIITKPCRLFPDTMVPVAGCNDGLMARTRIPQHSDEWHRVRGTLITGTNLASIVGTNPYCSATALFKQKTGQIAIPPVNNIACRHGTLHESEAANVYSSLMNIPLIEEDIGLVVHPSYSWLAASPDRVASYLPLLIEIKCPWKRKIIPSCIPTYYLPQIQLQMEVCDIEWCHFVQYIPPTADTYGQLDITLVQRDHEWWSKTLPVASFFYQMICNYYKEKGAPIGSLIHHGEVRHRPSPIDDAINDEHISPPTESLFST